LSFDTVTVRSPVAPDAAGTKASAIAHAKADKRRVAPTGPQ
jgi:hypothetical protein